MKKKLFSLLTALVLCLLCAVPAFAEMPLVMDTYELFKPEATAELEQKAQDASAGHGVNVYLLTVSDIGGQNVREFAKDWYRDYDLGYGEGKSGILFLIALDSRDYVTITYGGGVTAFTDYRIAQFDANASGSGQYEATTSSSHRSGDYVITTTRHYDVRRAGTTQFMGVPVDGSTKMPNGHMDAIEPYDYRAFQPFSTAYLPGYMADKYDEDADTCQARAHSRMQNSVSSELSASITGYNSVTTLSENIHIDYTAKHYALLPVWMLHTKWQGKDYLFAMNGQTGKLVGDLPVDNRKVAAWFAGISVPLMILLAILL